LKKFFDCNIISTTKQTLQESYSAAKKVFENVAPGTIKFVLIGFALHSFDGEPSKSAERKEVFDKYLNYPKTNGMLASEFIFTNITNEIKKID